jgi:hypothetical protein
MLLSILAIVVPFTAFIDAPGVVAGACGARGRRIQGRQRGGRAGQGRARGAMPLMRCVRRSGAPC